MTATIYLLDPNLKDLVGHYFEYDRSIAEAAIRRGMKCLVVSNKEAALPEHFDIPVTPGYSSDIWKTLPGESYHSVRNLEATNREFAGETRAALAEKPPVAGDTIFFPTLTKAQLLGAVEIGEEFAARGVRTEILLRYPKVFFDGPVAEKAFRKLEQAVAKGAPIALCTDSDRLAEQLGAMTTAPVRVFPIPHATATPGLTPGDPSRTIHFVSLGNARGEKGLKEIVRAIQLFQLTPHARRARFTLQVNDPSGDVKGVIKRLAKGANNRVKLIHEPLTSEAYYALLREADVVLLPYHREIYAERTSGVFLEATTAGKVVICTKDTWMSDLLSLHGGGVAIEDKSALRLFFAMLKVIRHFATYQENAVEAGTLWRSIHTPDSLLDHLMGKTQCAPVVRVRKRAAVFYPWGDLLTGKSGAAVRLRLLVKVLERSYEEVRVLSLSGGEPGGMLTDRTVVETFYYRSPLALLLRLVFGALAFVLSGRPSKSFHLWYHVWPMADRAYARRCDDLVRWADDIFVEYSYSAMLVSDSCQRLRKTFVLTQHDIVSEQSKGVPLLYRLTKRFEFAALRAAPRLFVATEKERDICNAQGIAAEIAPHPIDLDEQISLSADEAAFIVQKFFDVPSEKPLCFFVGSRYAPNIKAAAEIMNFAKQAPEITFVVAGSCMAPMRDGNFLALGVIEQVALAAFYRQAKLVLSPLTEGTGSSVKSLEAMAQGVAVLSTSVGMRGIPVEDGVNCITEDDFGAWVDRIRKLSNDETTLNSVRAEARKLGARYDYRNVFAAYPIPPARTAGDPQTRDRHKFIELLPRAQKMDDRRLIEFTSAST